MKKAIKELWNGDISPYIALGQYDGELHQLDSEWKEMLNKLQADKENSGRLYDACCESVSKYAEHLAQTAFEDGFSLGVKLTAEAFCRETPCE